jgi:hypothetical protein
MWFNINYYKLVSLLLPDNLRAPKLMSLFSAYVLPIQYLHIQWITNRDKNWYIIKHTGQVYSLRNALNDFLDPSLMRIYISDGNSFPRDYIYITSENKPVYLGKIFIKTSAEYFGTGVDFYVHVPTEIIESSIYEIKHIVELYRLASKRYIIIPI